MFGREEQNSSEEKNRATQTNNRAQLTNRVSFGLLDRPETQQNINTETE